MTINFNNFNINENDYLIVGCSAGPDSMSLLHYLKHNTKNKIVCAHVNHNVRIESTKEEDYLKKYCQNENIIFESITITTYQENNFENEARKKRYKFYEKILTKYNSKFLFLAHHGDDLIETILMKIARGSNIEGYAGIKKISKIKNYYIIRPLLDYTKDDLIKYNKEHNIKYYIDKSNNNILYTRNRYRKYILPKLKDENINIHKQYLKYSNTLLEYNNYIKEEANKYIKKIWHNNKLDLLKWKNIHPFIKKNILFEILNNIYNNTPNIITEKHINNIIKLIENNKPNLTLNLPKQFICIKEYNYLYIKKIEHNKENYKIPLKDINIIDNHIIEKIDKTPLNGNDICKLNSNKIKLPLYIRNKKEGDTIEQLGLNGRKKIKEIFIENKIPKQNRDRYPLLVDSQDRIIWIPSLKKSKFNIQNNEFYDIILKYHEKEEKNE